MKQEEIKGWILHPGGARLLGNVEKELGICKCDTQPSWDILGNVGNLSSATILFILQEWLEKRPLKTGEHAMAAAFGPGFSAEFLIAAMELSVIVFLLLLVSLRFCASVELRISRRHQQEMVAQRRIQSERASLSLDGGSPYREY